MRALSPQKRRPELAAFALLYLVISQAAAAAQEYTVIDIGRLLGDRNVARGLSFSGQVAGKSGSLQGTGTRAFVWTPAGGPQSLGTLPGGDYSGASAVNISGQVVGSSNTGSAIRAFLWTLQGGMEDLGSLPGDNSSKAYAINNAGQVAGSSGGPGGIRAFLWTRNGGMQELDTLPGYPLSVAVDISERGDLAGYVSRSDGLNRAVRWSPGIQDLGVLPPPYNKSSKAFAINNAGHVVGYSSGPSALRAFLWTPGGGMEDLGALPGGSNSRALYINQAGNVVGGADNTLGPRAFLWTRKDGMRDLNNLIAVSGLTLVQALSINDLGQIVAVGIMDGGGGSGDGHDDHHDLPTSVFLLIPR